MENFKIHSKFSYLKVQSWHISKLELCRCDNSLICIFLDCQASVAGTDNWATVLQKISIISPPSIMGERTVVMLMYVFINPISIKKDISRFFLTAGGVV